MRPRCLICKRALVNHYQRYPELYLYKRPDGSEAWLCGRDACEREYAVGGPVDLVGSGEVQP